MGNNLETASLKVQINILKQQLAEARKNLDYRFPEGLGWNGVDNCVELLKKKKEDIDELKKQLVKANVENKKLKEEAKKWKERFDLETAHKKAQTCDIDFDLEGRRDVDPQPMVPPKD